MGVRRVVVAAALVVVAGCGQQDAPSAETPTPTEATTPPTPTTTSSPSPAPAEPTGLGAAPDDTWSSWARGSRVSDVGTFFTTADGTVACAATATAPASVRCDRTEGLGVDQPRPAGCSGAWGDAVEAVAGRGGALVCAGVTVLGREGATVLAEGEAASYGDLSCAVRGDAVQCLTPTPTGHRGFVVSPRVLVVR